jgi:hypothetical protein
MANKESNQARVEQAAHLAERFGDAGQAVEFGPQVLALQQSVLAGLVRSQDREAQRLRARHGDDDPRIARALERAQRFGELREQAGAQGEAVQRLAQTFQRDAMFHGYVLHADGSAAANHTVRLALRPGSDTKQQPSGRALSGKTDSSGYFRIELGKAGHGRDDPREGLTRWVQRVAQAMSTAIEETQDDDGANGRAPTTDAAADTGAEEAPPSAVDVLDAGGRLVHQDPIPPSFDGMASEFRFYALADSEPAPPAPPKPKPRKKR